MSCFAWTQQRAVCLQIPSGSVWKTKRGFTSTSLSSYNKQNNVFLTDGESCLPFPLPALVQSDWLVVGFPWLQLVVSQWWMGKVGGGCLLPFSSGTSNGLTGTLWHTTRADVHLCPLAQKMPAFPLSHSACFTSHADTCTEQCAQSIWKPVHKQTLVHKLSVTFNFLIFTLQ